MFSRDVPVKVSLGWAGEIVKRRFFGWELIGVGVKFFVDFAEMLVGDMSVDLGGADIGVAEHGLDGANVSAVHEEIGGERMTEGMRGNVFGNAGGTSAAGDHAFDAAGGETAKVA